jgi:hypothetical protein
MATRNIMAAIVRLLVGATRKPQNLDGQSNNITSLPLEEYHVNQ